MLFVTTNHNCDNCAVRKKPPSTKTVKDGFILYYEGLRPSVCKTQASTESSLRKGNLLQLFYDRLGVARDRQFLVSCDNGNRDGRIFGGDERGVTGLCVDFLVQLHTGKRKVIDDAFTQSRLILA